MAKTILTARQLEFLELVNSEKTITNQYYWTGGTVLAEFYLRHRLSEDIDLFIENEEVNPEIIDIFLTKNCSRLGVESIKKNRFLGLYSYQLIYKNKEILKIDFNYYPFLRINRGGKYKNIEIDSEYDIAVNKVHTIAIKPRARDFIDIFFLVKEKKYNFRDLILQAKAKFDWHIDYIEFGSQLLRAQEVKDYPKMIKKIDHRQWQEFFLKEAMKLKKEIFTK